MNQNPQAESTNMGWRTLYILGGAAALIAVLVFRRNLGAEFHLFKGFGIWDVPAMTPISAGDWFALLQNNPFVSLILFGLFDLINYALVGLIFLALYGALQQINKSAMVVATTFGFVGISGLLCLESGLCHAEPQRALCSSDHRCAASDVPGRRRGAARALQSRSTPPGHGRLPQSAAGAAGRPDYLDCDVEEPVFSKWTA